MRKIRLYAPGPTEVPPQALLAMAQPILHHRTPQFQAILAEVAEGLGYLFQTKSPVITLAGVSTAAMEASVSNFLSPGDTAICIRGGKFGERWAEICTAYGVKSVNIDPEWGSAASPEDLEKALKANPDAKAVYATLVETSTGVLSDIEAFGRIVAKTDAILVVDAVSSIGAVELLTDTWNVDVVAAGSQKAVMLPPGLGFASVSDKAWALTKSARCPRYYLDLAKAHKSMEKNSTPFTAPVSLIIGLRETLAMVREEGMEALLARHRKLAEACRAGVEAMGLTVFSKAPAPNLTAVSVPDGIDGDKFVKTLRDEYSLTIAGGQAQLKGKIFRISHMGYADQIDVLTVLGAVELVLSKMGYKGSGGASAAAKVLAG